MQVDDGCVGRAEKKIVVFLSCCIHIVCTNQIRSDQIRSDQMIQKMDFTSSWIVYATRLFRCCTTLEFAYSIKDIRVVIARVVLV